jgi:ribosomal protein L32
LEDIKKKNEEQKCGNIKIPNTSIMLINYSFCPKCKTIFSLKEITNYYINPRSDQRYKNKAHQYRVDTRVYCYNCGAYFLPSLVISDGTPKNEVQFLCRTQTISAVERYFSRDNINVLTKNRKNIIRRDNVKAIKNDVAIKYLEGKPTLITNMIQYTPCALIMNLIDGTNIEKGDLLFNEWK